MKDSERPAVAVDVAEKDKDDEDEPATLKGDVAHVKSTCEWTNVSKCLCPSRNTSLENDIYI